MHTLSPMTTATASPITRRRSRLAIEADAAARALLLSELERCDWRLTDAAESLDIGGVSGVLRSIRHLDLVAEYDAARLAGKIRPGPRPK